MIACSYWTNEVYKAHAVRLAQSLDRLKIRHRISQMPDLASRQANILQKPGFILDSLEANPDDAVLWLDADAVVRSAPRILVDAEKGGYDVAAYCGRYHGDVWAGTLMFCQTGRARAVLDSWIKRCKERPDRLDQVNLRFALFLDHADASFLALPAEYCWIDRLMRNPTQESPIIEHLAPSFDGAPEKLDLDPVDSTYVNAYHGIGDTFYMRPAVKALSRKRATYVATSWPQLFAGDPRIKVVRPRTVPLRVQKRNVAAVPAGTWAEEPRSAKPIMLSYNSGDYRAGKSVVRAFMDAAELEEDPKPEDFRFSVPEAWFRPWMNEIPRPFGVVHAPSVRTEWENTSRNPRPDYIQDAVDAAPFVRWVSVGWLEEGKERLAGKPLSGVSERFDHGELAFEQLVALVSMADVAICGPCFLLPMAASVGTPVFVVFGGSVPPGLLVDRVMGTKIQTIAPDPYCACLENNHGCRKDIHPERLSREWDSFLKWAGL